MDKITKTLIAEAKKAFKKKEVPVGCLIVENKKIISKGYNRRQKTHKCIDHAEIIAITKAAKKKKDWRLDGCELYVTLKPCNMCMEVIKQSRIKKIYYLLDSKYNNEKSREVHEIKIEGSSEIITNYSKLLSSFFADKR